MESIKKAIEISGGSFKFSRLLGISENMPHRWKRGIRFPSVSMAIKIEELTNGEVKAQDILSEKQVIILKKRMEGK